jgi:hypothetical protein
MIEKGSNIAAFIADVGRAHILLNSVPEWRHRTGRNPLTAKATDRLFGRFEMIVSDLLEGRGVGP